MCWILATSVVLPRGRQCCLVHGADAELTRGVLMYMEEQPLEQKDQVVLYVSLKIYSFVGNMRCFQNKENTSAAN